MAGTNATSMFWFVPQMLAVTDMTGVLRWARLLAHAGISPWGLVSSRTDMLRPYNTACRWLYLRIGHCQNYTSLMFLVNLTHCTFFLPLWFYQQVQLVCVYCMQCLPWWFNNDFLEIECSELALQKDRVARRRKIVFCLLSPKPTKASEVYEREISSSSSTERPPGQTLGSCVRGAGGVGNENRRGRSGKLVDHSRRGMEIPEALRFLSGARVGPALFFGGIQRRENAKDGSGQGHPGAGRGGSPCSPGGHRWARAGREEGRKTVELSWSGRHGVAVVLELVVVAWIQGSAEAPGHGCSCEHFDDPSGFNSIGILFLTPK